jgi:hypothetical protein
MAAPVVVTSVNKPPSAPYAPGEAITVSWTVTDADNATEALRLMGRDSQNNEVTVDLNIARQDTFTMTRVFWPRTNVDLVINNGTRQATGVVPTA